MTGPAPKAEISVPIPTGPPSSQPSRVAVVSRAMLTAAMGIRLTRFARPTSSVSRGPQPRDASI